MDRASRRVAVAAVAALALACASAGPGRRASRTGVFPVACGDAAIATLPPEIPAVFAKAGWKKADFVDRKCFWDRLGLANRSGWRGVACTRFMVDADGGASEFAVVGTPVPGSLEEGIRSAVVSCRFTPARDAEGRPAATWLVLPLHFGR